MSHADLMRFRLRTIRTFAVLCKLQRLHYPECFAESSEHSVIRLPTLSSVVLCSILSSPSTCWDWLSWGRPVRSSSLCLRGNRSCPSSPCWWRLCTARWAWLTHSCVCTSACCGGTRSPNSCEAASRTWEVAGSIPDTPTRLWLLCTQPDRLKCRCLSLTHFTFSVYFPSSLGRTQRKHVTSHPDIYSSFSVECFSINAQHEL